jgi:hypothetical protein
MKPVVLHVKGMGHVPSFKNKKRAIVDGKTGKTRTLTEPKTKAWMEKCEASFESQLRSAYQTIATGTQTVRSLRSWIACVAPLNDSVRHIIEERIRVEFVAPGEEGASLTIERET